MKHELLHLHFVDGCHALTGVLVETLLLNDKWDIFLVTPSRAC